MNGLFSLALATVTLSTIAPLPADAQTLQGHLIDENLRLMPAYKGNTALRPGGQSLRILRAPGSSSSGLVDASAFAPPLSGRASGDNLHGGIAEPGNFARPPRNFDIGAERGSREMVLAWERWHKQISEAIYTRWQRAARDPGRATIKITVTRDRQLMASILDSSGGAAFDECILGVIASLNDNPGLSFPAGSQRKKVSFDADYIASSDVKPGYSWVKIDYERVRQDY